jgi:rubrerythrin
MSQTEGQEGMEKADAANKPSPELSREAVILDLAMKKEEYSVRLYKALFEFVEREDSRKLLKHLIEEESEHYKLLRAAMITGSYDKLGVPFEGESLEMTDYLIKKELRKSSKPEDIVKFAIRREEESEEFYLSRLYFVEDEDLKTLYQRLAREEGNHRKKLMGGYDDLVIMNFA